MNILAQLYLNDSLFISGGWVESDRIYNCPSFVHHRGGGRYLCRLFGKGGREWLDEKKVSAGYFFELCDISNAPDSKLLIK